MTEEVVSLSDDSEFEWRREALSNFGKRCAPLSTDNLIDLIERVTQEMDWPVRRAAVAEIQKRFNASKRDKLRVQSKPNGTLLGSYRVGISKKGLRPYDIQLYSIAPIDGTCSCPDFLVSSLGICKHLFAVLVSIYGRSSAVKRALLEQSKRSTRVRRDQLRWDACIPATGPSDPLARIKWHRERGKLQEIDQIDWRARKWFQSTSGGLVLKETFAEDPRRRAMLVDDLLGIIKRSTSDTALIALLRLEQERLSTFATFPAHGTLTAHLKTLKKPLFPYQHQAVEHFVKQTRLLLGDDMGLGKTAQATACAHVLWRSGQVKRGLLIVPASLKGQWLSEWQQFSNTPIVLVDGAASERKQFYESKQTGFLVANYEQILKDLTLIQDWAPEMVILDEGQRIKNWETKTSLYIKTLSPKFRLVLTGTPLENRLLELASILDWLDPGALAPKWRLTPWHSVYIDGEAEVGGARNLDTLRVRLKNCLMRRRRSEVLKQLPPRTDTIVPVELTPEQQAEHSVFSKPILRLMSIARKRPLTQAQFLALMGMFTKQRIICNGMAQYNFENIWPDLSKIEAPHTDTLGGLSSPKLELFSGLVLNLTAEQGRKIVVFSQWQRMLKLAHWSVEATLLKQGVHCRFFTGAESQKRRRQNVIDFNDDPAVRVLFLTDAGGVGLNLQRAANCCINLDLPWNPAVLEQRIGRIYRLGQKDPVDIYKLISNDGIEARIASIISSKQAFFNGLFDGQSNEISFDGNGSWMGQLQKLIEVPVVPQRTPARKAYDDQQVSKAAEEELSPETEYTSDLEGNEAANIDNSSLEDSLPKENGQMPITLGNINELSALVGALKVERKTKDTLTISASGDAAKKLAGLLEGFANLLRGQ